MARYDGSVKFDARIDSSKFKSDLDSIKSVSKKAFSAIGLAAGAMVTGISAAGIGFESAFAGVKKTVNATTQELEALKGGIRDMAKEIPTAANEIAGIAESAGQLGIKTENILEFTRTMADLGVATNLAGEEAASTLAKFANITQMPQEKFSNLGSTIVALGNNLATTEADIAAMSLRLAGAGTQAGLSESQILSFAGALSSVGIEAEAGGSAFSRVMTDMQLQVETNGEGLKDYAKVAGMTTAEFKKAFKEDAAGAIIEFIKGLNNTERNGKSATQVLAEMGIEEIRLSDALKRAAGASDVFESAIKLGNQAWEENNALTKEAEQRYQTTESKLKILGNQVKDLGISAWDAFSGQFGDGIDAASEKVEELSASMENGKLKDATENVGDLFGSLVDVAVDLAGVALPPLISALGFVGDHFGLIAGVVGPATAAILAYKGATVVANVVETASMAIKAAHTAGVSGLNIAISLLNGNLLKETTLTTAKTVAEGAATVGTQAHAAAQTALNAALSANPIGAVIGILALLVGITAAVVVATNRETEAEKQHREAVEANTKAIDAQTESYRKTKEACDEAASGVLAEYEHTADLAKELLSLADANGKVEDTNKSRVSFILGKLNGALGTEYELVGNTIQRYGDLKDSIYSLIEAKKAEALANAYQQDYENALKSRKAAQEQLTEAQRNAAGALSEISAAETKALEQKNNSIQSLNDAYNNGKISQDEYLAGIERANQTYDSNMIAINNLRDAHKEELDALTSAQTNLDNCNATITNYEHAMTNLANGNMQGAIDTFENMGASAEKGASDTNDAIAKLGDSYQNNLNQLQSAMNTFMKEGTQEAYNEVVAAAKNVMSAKGEYEAAGGVLANGLVTTMEGEFDISGLLAAISASAGEVNTKAAQIGTNIDTGFISGMNEITGDVYGKGLEIGTQATDGVADGAGCHSPSEKTYNTGLYIDQGLANGISDGESGVVNAAIAVAQAAITAVNTTLDINSPSKVMRDGAGLAYGEGFADGITKSAPLATKAATVLGNESVLSLKESIDSHSPAKDTEKVGDDFDAGFANGIEGGTDKVTEAARELGESAVDALEQSINTADIASNLSDSLSKGLKENAEKMTERFEKSVEVLDLQLDFDILSEEQYYEELGRLRDEYLTAHTKEWYEATLEIRNFQKDAAKKAAENAKRAAEEARKKELDLLEYRYNVGIITEREYYEKLEEYRDKHFQKGSAEWRDYTLDIFNYYKEQALKAFEDVTNKQKSMLDKLSDYGSLTKTITVKGWYEDGSDLVWDELADFDKEIDVMKAYSDNINSISERMKTGGFDADSASKFKEIFADMSVEEGASFARLLTNAADDEFYDYVSGYFEKMDVAEQLSKEIYSDEFEVAADDAANIMTKAFEAAGYEVPEGFFDIGTDSAKNFSKSFLEEIGNMLQPFREAILSCMPDFATVFGGAPGGQSYTANYNFYSNGDTTARQIQAAQAASERDKLSGGY